MIESSALMVSWFVISNLQLIFNDISDLFRVYALLRVYDPFSSYTACMLHLTMPTAVCCSWNMPLALRLCLCCTQWWIDEEIIEGPRRELIYNFLLGWLWALGFIYERVDNISLFSFVLSVLFAWWFLAMTMIVISLLYVDYNTVTTF